MFGLKVGVRYDDLKKVPKITDEITAWFGSHPGVDTRFSYGARLASLGEYSVNISLTVSFPAYFPLGQVCSMVFVRQCYKAAASAGTSLAMPVQLLADGCCFPFCCTHSWCAVLLLGSS